MNIDKDRESVYCTPFLNEELFSTTEHHIFAVRMLTWRRDLGLLHTGSVHEWCQTLQKLRSDYDTIKQMTIVSKEVDMNFDANLVEKDMCRLYIDGVPDDYFHTTGRRGRIKNVLTVWCAHHPPYYRQGMHEICALLLLALDMEAEALGSSLISTISRSPLGEDISVTSDVDLASMWRYVVLAESNAAYDTDMDSNCCSNEGDLYWLFTQVMQRGLQEIYKPDPAVDGAELVDITARPTQYRSWEYLNHIQDVLVRAIHPILWEHLQLCLIQPQLYSVSWTRLLFGRMFPPPLIFDLWDYLFESDLEAGQTDSEVRTQMTDFPILVKVASCITALLIHLRGELLRGDELQVMTLLMRFAVHINSRGGDRTLSAVIGHARSIESYVHSLSMDPPSSTHAPHRLMMTFRGDFSSLTPRETIVLSGYLSKRGKVVHSWKRRWIVLTKHKMSYYTDESMTNYRGQVLLTPESAVVNEDGRVHRLKFMITQPGHRSRVFQTSNEESRNVWVRTISSVLEQLQQDAFMGADSVWEDIGEGEERDSSSVKEHSRSASTSVTGQDDDATSDNTHSEQRTRRFNISGVWRRVGTHSALTGGDNHIPLSDKDNILIRKHYSHSTATSSSSSSATVSTSSLVSYTFSNRSGPIEGSFDMTGAAIAARPSPLLTTYSVGLVAAGWLRKKGHINFNWKVRWFELSLVSNTEGQLSYYVNRCPGEEGWCNTTLVSSGQDSSNDGTGGVLDLSNTHNQQHQQTGETQMAESHSGTGSSQKSIGSSVINRFILRRDHSRALGCFHISKDTHILNRTSGPGSHKFALFNANGVLESTSRSSASSTMPQQPDRLGFVGRVKSEVLFLAAVSEMEKNEWMHLFKGLVQYLRSRHSSDQPAGL